MTCQLHCKEKDLQRLHRTLGIIRNQQQQLIIHQKEQQKLKLKKCDRNDFVMMMHITHIQTIRQISSQLLVYFAALALNQSTLTLCFWHSSMRQVLLTCKVRIFLCKWAKTSFFRCAIILLLYLFGSYIKMSKKYFINNLDTPFGQALLAELVKEPTEDPTHMCTVRVPAEQKPQGIKKVLKRQKPKLFRKKAIEECQVYVYSLDQTELTDIQFGIETMGKPFEDNKVFILVSDIMVWSNSPRKIKKEAPPPPVEGGENAEPPAEPKPEDPEPQDQEGKEDEQQGSEKELEHEEKPIEYTFYEESDYESRVALPQYQFMRDIEDKVLSIKRQNVKVFVVCPGVIYGCGEDTFYPLFRAAWLQDPLKLPYLGEGFNKLPTVHLRDLVKFVVKVAEAPPENSPYLFAFDQTQDRSQKAIIQAISSGIGSGKVQSVKKSPLIENEDRYLIDLDMRSSKLLIGTAEEPVQFEWVSRKGIGSSIQLLLKDFAAKESLRPLKFVLLQGDSQWKKSKADYILKVFAEYYRIPVLNIKGILQSAKELSDDELIADLREEWAAVSNYLSGEMPNKDLDETMKVFYRAIRWRLSQNDCKNRGYILENFPRFTPELEFIFNKISLKKLKRKKPKVVPLPKATQKSIVSQEDVPPPPAEEEPKEEQPAEEAAEEQGGEEEAGPKIEPYYPESIISIKRMGTPSTAFNENVVDFFTSRGMEELVYDTSNAKQHQIFESLRSYIERNGRPNNYLLPEQALLKRHREFTTSQNKESLQRKENQVKKRIQTDAQIQSKRKKLAEDICELVRNEGEEEIKKMPFRNYLMEFVVPTLNVGLLEVSNIIPNDPVDLLAEFLYQKSYDA